MHVLVVGGGHACVNRRVTRKNQRFSFSLARLTASDGRIIIPSCGRRSGWNRSTCRRNQSYRGRTDDEWGTGWESESAWLSRLGNVHPRAGGTWGSTPRKQPCTRTFCGSPSTFSSRCAGTSSSRLGTHSTSCPSCLERYLLLLLLVRLCFFFGMSRQS